MSRKRVPRHIETIVCPCVVFFAAARIEKKECRRATLGIKIRARSRYVDHQVQHFRGGGCQRVDLRLEVCPPTRTGKVFEAAKRRVT